MKFPAGSVDDSVLVNSNFRGNPYSRTKSGKRADLNNIYFRSKAEANYARCLTFFKIKWEYEPREFFFDAIRRGVLCYTPDFYLPEDDKWIEFKGWFRDKDFTKFKRFKKFFPEEFEKLHVVFQEDNKKSWEATAKLLAMGIPLKRISFMGKKFAKIIPNWE